ncbi:protein FAR1-RELATED SEQUENCE 8-like [Silene latifolia]|uniref:protein FAR1-RELATED SEQUENCE 8-like n=1 Tax=Silene latifolia TaxID=37657 RepID=UPI003D786259
MKRVNGHQVPLESLEIVLVIDWRSFSGNEKLLLKSYFDLEAHDSNPVLVLAFTLKNEGSSQFSTEYRDFRVELKKLKDVNVDIAWESGSTSSVLVATMDADSTDINMQTDSSTVTQPHSTPIVQEQPNPQPNNQLVLSHTPNGGERWMRVVEHKFRPTIGAVSPPLRLESSSTRDLNKISRSLDMFQKTLILDNSKLNIGAGLTFRQVKELVNGYENIGATLIDFKNFQRDIKCYIGLRDADLFIDRLEKLKATQPQFYFAYDVDPQNRLTKFFWADATCIRNYSFFGDAVSFDPTYGTNKYDMHFLTAMGQKESQFMITNQCPGIKKAFPSVFKIARHRYCMWHITQKITDKVGSALCRDTDFLARFNAVVWDPDMEPSEFEEKWKKVISDFELEDNDWLTTMFDDRHHWIPAYHRDLALGCILRTTQRSESTNSFFKRYENHFGTLVEFWMSGAIHEGAMIITNDHSFPELKTELPIEKHGAIIYTHAVFKVFQEEVMVTDSCGVDDFEKEEHVRIIHVIDAETDRIFKVRLDLRCTDAAYCVGVQGQRNWANTKQLDSNGNVIEDSYMATSDNSHLCNVWSEFRQIVGVLKTLPAEHAEELASLLVEFRQKLCIEPLTKDQEMEMLLGCNSSSEVTIHPPEQARNKGSGKRLK